jgi:RNA polymerase sigma factor (sigma-70 family)
MNLPATPARTDELDVVRQLFAEELERHERLVLMLFYVEGLSFADIAELLELPVAAVARLYRETMATIRERLG